jgi:hypothetical protein
MFPDPAYLLSKLDLSIPLIAVYDAPDTEPFEPLVHFPPQQRACLFEFYNEWITGRTLVLTKDDYGCGGCGTWWFDRQTRSRQGYLDFLANKEGLKASEDLMAFTVNKEMYENLCRLDEKSFLAKPFLKILKNARGGKLE